MLGFLLITIFFCLFFYTVLKQKAPKSTLAGFNSPKSLFAIYKNAFKIISEIKWIYLIPIILVTLQYLLGLYGFINARISFQYPNGMPLDFDTISVFKSGFISNQDVLYCIVRSVHSFIYGFSTIFMKSKMFYFVFIVITILYKFIIGYLNKISNPINAKHIKFLEKILLISLIINVLIITSIFVENPMEFSSLNYIIILALELFSSILRFVFFTFIEAIILFYILSLLNSKEFNFNEIINHSLINYKSLIYYNLYIYFTLQLPHIFFFIKELIGNLNLSDEYLKHIFTMESLYYNCLLFYSISILLTLSIPFIIIINQQNLVKSFKNNFKFIYINLLKYLIIIGIGLIILFIPTFFSMIVEKFILEYSYLKYFLTMSLEFAKLILSIFFLISYMFFINNTLKKPLLKN